MDRLEEFAILSENLNSLNDEELVVKIKLLEEIKEEICYEFNIKHKQKAYKIISEIESSPIQINTSRGLMIQIGRNMSEMI